MELHDDDKPVGRVLSRREVIKFLGGGTFFLLGGTSLINFAQAQDATATAAASGTQAAMPACVVRPEVTEGPYFVDEVLKRSDLRIASDGSVKEGIPLRLIFNVSSISSAMCTPLEGVHVDVWHCDALGQYSGVQDAGFAYMDETWLRGYQITDKNGVAEFLTIYPGWYSGRAVHIHFKIRTDPTSEDGYEFTSQLFFPEELSDQVFTQEPYASKGQRNTFNSSDGIYGQVGDQLLISPVESTADEIASAQATLEAMATPEATAEPTSAPVTQNGYTAVFTVGLDLSDASVGASDSAAGGGMGGSGRGAPPAGGLGGPRPGSTPTTTGS
jgi:protocatechuate 3,4-dioxygenase beta subunit